MLNELPAASVATLADEPSNRTAEGDRKIVYWHRELPPIDAESIGEHTVEADSMRVVGNLAHRDELWDQCYRDLMDRVHLRLDQEVHRLGGDYAHVLDETIGSKHDYHSGEVWLHGRITYSLLRRPKDL
jgi:hypothetical protein